MPLITRWFIKASLLYLVISLGIAVRLAVEAGGAQYTVGLSAVFFHFFLVGWVTQMIIGVAYWLLPKYSREQPRRSEPLAWAIFWLLNIGLILRGMAEPNFIDRQEQYRGYLLMVSAIVQWLAGLFFIINSWGRVKER